MQRGTDGQGSGIVPETSAAKVIMVAPVLHSAAYACVAALAALTEMADGSCQQSAAAGVKRSAARMAKGLLLVVAPRTAAVKVVLALLPQSRACARMWAACAAARHCPPRQTAPQPPPR